AIDRPLLADRSVGGSPCWRPASARARRDRRMPRAREAARPETLEILPAIHTRPRSPRPRRADDEPAARVGIERRRLHPEDPARALGVDPLGLVTLIHERSTWIHESMMQH